MYWYTTEELYANLLAAEEAAASSMSKAGTAERIAKENTKIAELQWDEYQWKMDEIRELKAELAKRAGRGK